MHNTYNSLWLDYFLGRSKRLIIIIVYLFAAFFFFQLTISLSVKKKKKTAFALLSFQSLMISNHLKFLHLVYNSLGEH